MPRAARRRWPSRDEIRAFAARGDRAVDRGARARAHRAPIDPVLAGGPPSSRSSSTSRCTRRRCSTCGTACRTTQKRRPRGRARRDAAASRRRTRGVTAVPAGTATLGADRDGVPFGWDNEFAAHASTCRRSRSTCYNVTNRDYPRVRRGGRLREAASSGTPRTGRGAQRERRRASALLGARDAAPGSGGGMWERIAAAAGLARVREPRRGVGVRALEGPAAADRGRVPPRRVRHADGRASAPFPWGDAPPGRDARQLRLRGAGTRCPSARTRAGASAWGVHDLVGNGWEWTSTVFAPFQGFAPMPSYPQYSADFFDGKHYVHEGRLARDGAASSCAAASATGSAPNYPYVYAKFRRALDESIDRQRGTPLSHRRASTSRRELRAPTCARDLALVAEAAPVEVPLRRPRLAALRGDLPPAVVPDHARRGRAARAARARRWSARARRIPRPRSSSSAAAAARSSRCSPRRCGAPARSARVHLIDISPTALELSERTLGRLEHVSVVGHRATYEEGLRHAARARPRPRRDARPLPRLEHRQLRPARPRASSCARSAARCARATRCCSAPTSSSRSATCCSPTTTRSA